MGEKLLKNHCPNSIESRPSPSCTQEITLLPIHDPESINSRPSPSSNLERTGKINRRIVMITLVSLLSCLLIAGYKKPDKKINIGMEGSNKIWKGIETLYKCPSKHSKISMNDKEDNFEEYGKKRNNNVKKNFRKKPFDCWGVSYNRVKKSFREIKKVVYVKHLKNGDKLYESACGVGLNLIMTLEILAEQNITNIEVYGNDYLEKSVQSANYYLSHEAPAGTKKGQICQGDSTNLDFVPSSSFDMVFTGYIDPIQDPLNLSKSHNSNNPDIKNCNAKRTEKKDLMRQAQLKQEDWYSSWVTEMIRITKPGKIISIESVSLSQCEALFDWGGVSTSWWKEVAVERYGWDVESDSITIYKTKNINSGRYQVTMRKNLET